MSRLRPLCCRRVCFPLSNDLNGAQIELIRAFALEHAAQQDAAHDDLHVQRVVANATVITRAERRRGVSVREEIVIAACWLHDLVQLPKGSGPAGESARRSATAAREFLAGIGAEDTIIDAVCHAVEAHSFSGGLRPETLEAAILQDADRLDALGAIGIARLWVTAAELNSRLYDAADPAATTRPLDDRRFGLDHIVRKLLALPETMTTTGGREEAARRAAYVAEYRARFLEELAGNSGGDDA